MLTLSLIFNQLLTKNQIFIFFLIPILAGFSQIYLKNIKLKHKSKIFIAIVLICFFSTIKYHVRFNENRKFHELSHVDFSSSIDASAIDKKLSGLNWISPFNKNPDEEINLAKFAKKVAFKCVGAFLAIQANKGIIETCPRGDSSAVFNIAMNFASTTPFVKEDVQL